MEQFEERQIRMDQKLDFIIDWIKDHKTLHTRITVGVFLLLLATVVGMVI